MAGIRSGKKVVLEVPTGCGKSSIVNLGAMTDVKRYNAEKAFVLSSNTYLVK